MEGTLGLILDGHLGGKIAYYAVDLIYLFAIWLALPLKARRHSALTFYRASILCGLMITAGGLGSFLEISGSRDRGTSLDPSLRQEALASGIREAIALSTFTFVMALMIVALYFFFSFWDKNRS